jgi:hypothetical protein
MNTESTVGGVEVFVLAIILLAVGFIGMRIRGIWSGQRATEEFVPPWWVWGKRSWRALVRATPSFYLSTVLLVLAFMVR